MAVALRALDGFGSNPGALGAFHYIPASAEGMPLVVALHGCTQTAEIYDRGAGWSTLAGRAGFALLLPEQRGANNDNRCFNWFLPGDNRRDEGEPLSIRQMIAAMIDRHGLDPARVFVTGLSAGGAMTSVMLAAYPEVFRGGAIIAGLPYGGVASVPQALERMAGLGHPTADNLARTVRQASSHPGPWPRVSVWHGSADPKVHPSNAQAIVGQWRELHGLPDTPSTIEAMGSHRRRAWHDDSGEAVIEEVILDGLAHGTPILASSGIGSTDPHALEAGLSSTEMIARFWQIA